MMKTVKNHVTQRTHVRLSDGSGTSEEMHTRRLRTGPGQRTLLTENSSGDDTDACKTAVPTPPTSRATSMPSSPRQSTLPELFSEEQFGFDNSVHAEVEAKVQKYIREAEADPQPDSALNAPITLPQLQTGQHRLNAASCHGKDTIPNAALKTELYELQILLMALLNAILHFAEFPLIWNYVLLSPLLKGGKGKSHKNMSDHRPIGLISTVAKLLEQILLPRLTELISNH